MNKKDRSEPPKVEQADLRQAKIDLAIMRYQVESAKAVPPTDKPAKVKL